MFRFDISKRDKTTNARVGTITTSHGVIKTPSFVPVGTKSTIKSLSSEEITKTKTQLFFVNTYHMMLRDVYKVVEKAGGVHTFMNCSVPVITDSGGFQVYSLARKDAPHNVKIDKTGVTFRSHIDGDTLRLTPKTSLKIQKALGSDIVLPLDDCTSYPITQKKAEVSMKITHQWADDALKHYETLNMKDQALYGIVQGSVYEDLRTESARFMAKRPFAGYAIGGVSVGESKEEMKKVCDWTTAHLPDDKPRHLLGVGEIDDIFEIIERGIDTFDCVGPTRIARMGRGLTITSDKKNSKAQKLQKRYEIDISKSKYKNDMSPIDVECTCWVCTTYTRSYIHHLFKNKELLSYRLITFHNVYFVNQLVSSIRNAIEEGSYRELKKKWII